MKAPRKGLTESAAGMTTRNLKMIAIVAAALSTLSGLGWAAQDRFTLKAANGVAFSEFRGYDTWQDVAVSQVEGGLKAILANPVMINAYRAAIPGNGKPFPEGSATVKIEWSAKKNPASPYPVLVPDTLKTVSFIFKDSTRFPETSGWGYAQFRYDAPSDTFKPVGNDSSFGTVCYKCHMLVKAQDYIFTVYPRR
jgi:hypothetical protein